MAENLESSLAAAHEGRKPVTDFLEELFQSRVIVLVDKEVGDDGRWAPSASPLILDDPAGTSMLAMFTSRDRADRWTEHSRSHPYPVLVDFSWVIRGIRNDLGIAINPGHALGAEIDPQTTAQMRAFAQRQHEATPQR